MILDKTKKEVIGNFADRLDDLIKSSGKTLDVIAKEANIKSKATLTKYRKGDGDKNEARISNLVKLAKYFNVTTDYLLGLTDALNPTDTAEGKILRNVCDYTGLTQNTVKVLHDAAVKNTPDHINHAINLVCNTEDKYALFRYIFYYINSNNLDVRSSNEDINIFDFEDGFNLEDNTEPIKTLFYTIQEATDEKTEKRISIEYPDNKFWDSFFMMGIQNALKSIKDRLSHNSN